MAAKNAHLSMKYFIPECDDRVDPDYDFIKDKSAQERNPYLEDVYAHEIYTDLNYDGLLVSKAYIEGTKKKKELVYEMGIHEYVRYPKDLPIMGDCGAFSYISDDEPPYQTDEILDYYENLGFDFGVSIDHLIVGDFAKDIDIRDYRYNLTMNNAEEFLKKHQAGNYTFTPIGVAQGWDPKSYRESVGKLIEMGYKYISLGGLARSTTKEILSILREVSPIIPEYLQLHLFGVARIDGIEKFKELGVTSFDSASYLRKAWLNSSSNYFSMDGNRYAAIRVPQADGRKVKKCIEQGIGTESEFIELEKQTLDALRKFDRNEMNLEDTLRIVLKYDEMTGNDPDKHEKLYRKTLTDQPWKHCGCTICQDKGIEVIIFRGNNRNRRRGFHNTYVFYRQFQDLIK